MQALTHSAFGEPAAVISLAEIPKPEPGPGEVRLRMLRSPIHNHDLATIRGVYGYKPKLPATAGTEMIGIVDACGEGVSQPAVGTRVAYLSRWGWAEYVVATASQCVPIPDGISDDMGAQMLAMPFSAVVLLDELREVQGRREASGPGAHDQHIHFQWFSFHSHELL